jgi:hypothetical protein
MYPGILKHDQRTLVFTLSFTFKHFIMKRILILIFSLFIFCDLWSQNFPTVNSVGTFVSDSIKARPDKINALTLNKAYVGILSFLPDIVQDTTSVTIKQHGFLRFQRKDSTAYVYDTIGYKRWRKYVPGTGGGGSYSDEQAQDAVGAMANAGEFTYNDAANTFSINQVGAGKITGTKTSAFISDFLTQVQSYGDAHYSLLSHSHTASDITNFVSAVRSNVSNGWGLLYNPSTGVFAVDSFNVATRDWVKKRADSVAANVKTLYTSNGTLTGPRTVTMASNPLTYLGGPVSYFTNSVGGFTSSIVAAGGGVIWGTDYLGDAYSRLSTTPNGTTPNFKSQVVAAGGVGVQTLLDQKPDSFYFKGDMTLDYVKYSNTPANEMMVWDTTNKRLRRIHFSDALSGAGFEVLTNKATNFSVINNTKYPTTQAVANHLAANFQDVYHNNYWQNGTGGDALLLNIDDSTNRIKNVELVAGTGISITTAHTTQKLSYTIAATGGGGGSFDGDETLFRKTVTAQDTVNILLTDFYATYNDFKVLITNLTTNTGATDLKMRIRYNGSSTFESGSTSYDYALLGGGSNNANAATIWYGMADRDDHAERTIDGVIEIHDPHMTGRNPLYNVDLWGINNSGGSQKNTSSVSCRTNGRVDEIQLIGTALSLTWKLKGSKN